MSGFSSGGFFAVQMQVAFSSIIKGAGIVAGGPYHCAAEHLLMYCMASSYSSLFVDKTASGLLKTLSLSGITDQLDDVHHMKHHKVYIISGSLDFIITRSVVNELYRYYVTDGHLVDKENVIYNTQLSAGHTFPTNFDAPGNSLCSITGSPFVSNCAFDGAGAILKHIYGANLSDPVVTYPHSVTNTYGDWITFNQTEFTSESLNSIGLADEGYVYVPKSCQSNTTTKYCRLHIVFHGCSQSYSTVGDRFMRNTGYDRWANTNHLIILFPQTKIDNVPHLTTFNGWLNNLNGCWDWLGFYGDDFATKKGAQMRAIKKMIDRIAS